MPEENKRYARRGDTEAQKGSTFRMFAGYVRRNWHLLNCCSGFTAAVYSSRAYRCQYRHTCLVFCGVNPNCCFQLT